MTITLHMDPPGPTPNVGGHTVLGRLDEAAVDRFLAAFAPGADPGLLFAELRQLGGALSCLDGSYCAFFVAIAATPELARAGESAVGAAIEAWERLRAVRSRIDPGSLFVAGHQVPGEEGAS